MTSILDFRIAEVLRQKGGWRSLVGNVEDGLNYRYYCNDPDCPQREGGEITDFGFGEFRPLEDNIDEYSHWCPVFCEFGKVDR